MISEKPIATTPNYTAIEYEELEKANKRLNISITFRQIKYFSFSSNTIVFWLYALVTEELKAGYEITVLANLIKQNGEIEENATEITCTLDSNVNPGIDKIAQANFKCMLNNLKESYYSLRLNRSEYVTSIKSILSDDEIILDPVLTADAISKGKLLDYSLEENQQEDKMPPLFISKTIKEDSCRTNGKFLIEGKINKNIQDELQFTIPVAYPNTISLDCKLVGKEVGDANISCQVDKSIEKTEIVIEQSIIKDGLQEFLLLKSFKSIEGISCGMDY